VSLVNHLTSAQAYTSQLNQKLKKSEEEKENPQAYIADFGFISL
jgi:hypothetical protein